MIPLIATIRAGTKKLQLLTISRKGLFDFSEIQSNLLTILKTIRQWAQTLF